MACSSNQQPQHGIEAMFVSDIPEYLTCAVCQLVLRNPLQISTCRHKFCTPCFDKLQTNAHNTNTEFVCPVERKAVDLSHVFKDKSISIVIGGLSVKCSSYVDGCEWIGELSNLSLHEKKCAYQGENQLPDRNDFAVIGRNEVMSLFQALKERLNEVETAAEAKDKDIAHLKHNIEEIKTESSLKIKELKDDNDALKREVKLLQKKNQEDVEQFGTKLENVMLKNLLLEQKLEAVEPQLSASIEKFQGSETILSTKVEKIDKEFKGLGIAFSKAQSNVADMAVLKREMEDMKRSQHETSTKLEELRSLKLEEQIGKLRTSLNTSLNKQYDKTDKLTSRVDCFSGHNTMQLGDRLTEMEKLLTNLEVVTFCEYSGGSNEIKLRWNLQNYQHFSDLGKDVYSPVFKTELGKYRFQLLLQWDKATGGIGVFLTLHRAANAAVHEELNSYSTPYSIGVAKREGDFLSRAVTEEHIHANRDKYFTIPAHENCVGEAFGFPKMVPKEDIDKYVINDTLVVTCGFKP